MPIWIATKGSFQTNSVSLRGQMKMRYAPSAPKALLLLLAKELARRIQEGSPAQGLQVNLVELTGIEPVASWLQTRRSPS
jgi:hypothetical protein